MRGVHNHCLSTFICPFFQEQQKLNKKLDSQRNKQEAVSVIIMCHVVPECVPISPNVSRPGVTDSLWNIVPKYVCPLSGRTLSH